MLIGITCQGSGGLPWSNLIHINLEWIHSLLFLVRKKVKPLLQSILYFHLKNTFFYFFFKVKAFLKYLDWFNLATQFKNPMSLCSYCLLINIQKKKIQNQHNNIQDLDSLCISHVMWLILFLLFYFSLQTLLFLNYLFIFLTVDIFFSFSLKPTYIEKHTGTCLGGFSSRPLLLHIF